MTNLRLHSEFTRLFSEAAAELPVALTEQQIERFFFIFRTCANGMPASI